ncbi:PTS sugar transporter subunit IIA [Vagococcus sp. BWB3-3]|uniref:Ascorbate-specific PTS system EIIA component n=1 Tax=Vagococcus allomyrinae TaxID=2794353 RepID=A0A940PEP6_9ENTE|nr:PTS sugar transporter subunit IIA [Vagococcus allomyrinae]MBP1043509.1 PTS sugar transporter subunit IIA [Vagococcus allomyrinae]
MLTYFFDHQLIRYCEEQPADWREAIKVSCQLLMERQIINQVYVDEVIACVEAFGPYIVIVPGVAMPHSSEQSQGVFGTAISFTKMKEPVVFDEQDAEKNASLFFTLAAKNPEEHMQNIANLSEMLMTDGLISALEATNNLSEFEDVMRQFS